MNAPRPRTGLGRRSTARRALVVALVAALGLLGLQPAPAGAASLFIASTPTADYQVDGTVYTTLIVGNTVYVGGLFKDAVAPDGTLVPRKNLAAFDMTTGDLVTSFRADAGSTVRALATDGGSLYVGGAFLTLGGKSRSYVGKVNLVTGALDPAFAPVADNSVRSLLFRGGALYVGGAFTHVDTVARSYVAKLDPTTGAGDNAFAPAPNGAVYALRENPAGTTLYLGGNFTTVGGTARNGIAAVAPATGAVSPIVFANAAKPTFALQVNEDGSRLFGAGGSATNSTAAWNSATGTRLWRDVTDGDNQALAYYRGEVYFGFHDGYKGDGSIKLLAADSTTGAVNPNFKPTFDLFWGVWAVDVSEKGLVVGGDFTSVAGLPTQGFARFPATSSPPPPPPATTSLLGPNTQWSYWDKGTTPAGWSTSAYDASAWPTGIPRLGYGDTFDTTVIGYGGVASSKYLTTYFRASFDLTSIPDSLDLEISDDDGAVVYLNGTEVARDNMPTGTVTSSTLALTDRSGGAETALAGYLLDNSLLKTGRNTVAVEVHQVSKSSSDLGLDLQLNGLYSTTTSTNQSPTAAWTATMSGLGGTFDASASSDPDGTVASYYWDFGDGTSGTGETTTHTYATGGDYQVTLSVLDDQGALDTDVQTVTAVSPYQTVIARGAPWRWKYDATAPPAGWNGPAFDSSSWSQGGAPLGFGDASVATNIDTFASTSLRPRAAYFTKSFTVTDPTKVSQLLLHTVANDGVVVYVNGTEVNRTNMPTGAVTSTTYASAAPRTSAAPAVTINADPGLLRAGTNVISAETHLNYRATPDVTFDLDAVVVTGNQRPVASFTSTSDQLTATFDGTKSADPDGTVASYAWAFGDGSTGTGPTPAHTYATSGTYPVTLTVTDSDGALGSTTQNVTVVTADPVVIHAGSAWHWRYVASAPPVAWASNTFDDSTWATGNAQLGFGDAGTVTNLDSFATTTDRPIAAQFRRTFQVGDASKVTALSLSTWGDDGAVVYVNGTEVGRVNMPGGIISFNTYASSSRSTATAKASPLTVNVPTGLLVTGTNTVAVETHLNYRATKDMSFDLTATLTGN